MDYRSLGATGAKVSPLCIGTMNFGNPTPEDEAIRIVHAALDASVNFFDTANMYNDGESERILGKALAVSGRRDQVIVATKAYHRMGPGPNDEGLSRLHLIRACEDSLRRLGTDWIDLYQMHRPDPTTPVEETLSALTDLVRAGKVRYIGSSTHPAWQIVEAILIGEMRGYARYVTEQPPYNLLDRRIENELVPMALKYGVGLIPWAPIAQGVLAGRYSKDAPPPRDSRLVQRGGIYAERVTEPGIEVGQRFAELARERGLTAAQFALLWVKGQPAITAPIYGVRTLAQLEEVLPVMGMTLTEADRAACDELNPPGSVIADFHNTAGWMKMRTWPCDMCH
ncbi:MAG: aldo/keto reductase [Ardenticatenaceae bacterium]|nr:aldo/keto reductase [Ardenticatenaceae bacterium]HBY96413.1 aldo/keto reductase [Chloroflexota bacterium]